MKIAISSGHAKDVAGAVGPEPWGLVEVDEARRIVNQVASVLALHDGIDVVTFHDNVSQTQDQNLLAIVSWHEAKKADINISVHLNAFEKTSAPRGVEVLYRDEVEMAREMSAAIAGCGLIDRGPKERTDLYFLNSLPRSILIETCFVDSETDARIYREMFNEICDAIANTLSDGQVERAPAPDDYPAAAEPERPVVKIDIEVPDGVEVSLAVNGLNVFLGTEDPD